MSETKYVRGKGNLVEALGISDEKVEEVETILKQMSENYQDQDAHEEFLLGGLETLDKESAVFFAFRVGFGQGYATGAREVQQQIQQFILAQKAGQTSEKGH